MNWRHISNRWTGVAASELLIKRVRHYDGLADRRQPGQLRRSVLVVMKVSLTLVIGLLLVAAGFAVGQTRRSSKTGANDFDTRCGWFSNPTPANAWLWDRDGEWIIGLQGGFQSEGEWPNFNPRQWVRRNGNYGYGCACLRVRVDKQTHQISQIKSSRALALTQCRRDPALKKWGRL